MRPLVSVVVVTHDGAGHLPACLDALEALSYPADRLEVLLVDNASPPDALAAVCRAHPAARVVPSPANLGFAGGCNLGIARAKGDFVALLNDDTQVEAGWLDALVDAALADPEAGVWASRIRLVERAPDGAPLLQSTGALLFRDGSSRDRGHREPDRGQYGEIEEVFGACGASMLLRRTLLEDVGPLEESFFLYYEDTDLCWRARAAGWKVVYVPGSIVWHRHQATVGRDNPAHLFWSDRNRLLLVLRNAGWSRVAWVWLRYAVGTLPGVSRAPVPKRVRVRALLSAWAHAPASLAARYRIRRSRRVQERDLARWLRPLP